MAHLKSQTNHIIAKFVCISFVVNLLPKKQEDYSRFFSYSVIQSWMKLDFDETSIKMTLFESHKNGNDCFKFQIQKSFENVSSFFFNF